MLNFHFCTPLPKIDSFPFLLSNDLITDCDNRSVHSIAVEVRGHDDSQGTTKIRSKVLLERSPSPLSVPLPFAHSDMQPNHHQHHAFVRDHLFRASVYFSAHFACPCPDGGAFSFVGHRSPCCSLPISITRILRRGFSALPISSIRSSMCRARVPAWACVIPEGARLMNLSHRESCKRKGEIRALLFAQLGTIRAEKM